MQARNPLAAEKSSATDVFYRSDFLRPFQFVILPFWHKTYLNGVPVTSGITAHLKKVIPLSELPSLIEVDYVMRDVGATYELEYETMLKYLNTLKLCAKFTLDHYDLLSEFYFTFAPKEVLLEAYRDLFRAKFDVIFRCIKEQAIKLAATEEHPLRKVYLDKINDGYKQLTDNYRDIEALLKEKIASNNPIFADEWKFRVYEGMFEALYYKTPSLSNGKDSTVINHKSEIGDIFDKLMGLDKTINNPCFHIITLLLRSRYEYTYDKKKRKAIKTLSEAKAYLEKNRTHANIGDEVYNGYMNNITIFHVTLLTSIIKKNKQHLDYQEVKSTVLLALKLVPTIHSAGSTLKEQCGEALLRLFDYFPAVILKKLKYAKLDDLAELAEDMKRAALLLQLFDAVGLSKTTGHAAMEHKRFNQNCRDLDKYIKQQQRLLLEKKQEDEKKFDELQEKIKQYEENFDEILKSLKETTVKVMVTRQLPAANVTPAIRQGAAPVSKANAVSEIKNDITPIYSVALTAKEFFRENTFGRYEDFITTQTEENKAEAMLYAGEKYILQEEYEKAFALLDSAILQLAQLEKPNLKVKEGIEFVLDMTKEYLEKQIDLILKRESYLKQSRENFIIELGLRRLKEEGQPAAELSPKSSENRETIFAIGYAEYSRIGEDKRKKGQALSSETLERRNLSSLNKSLTGYHQKTNELLFKVSPEKVVVVGDLPLDSKTNPMRLFSQKPKGKKQPAPHKGNKGKKKKR